MVRFETEADKREVQRWSRLAIQLVGAADTTKFDHITTSIVVRELQRDAIFEFLVRELPPTVWEISKITDIDRHKLSQEWRMMAEAYEPGQFHVTRNGLALLAAYVMHQIDIRHAIIPT